MIGDFLQLSREELIERCLQHEAVIEELRATIARQGQQISDLERKLAGKNKNSSNSSKPPSSDIVKPKGRRKDKSSGRKPGGQPGHPKHERPLLPPDQVDHFEQHRLSGCPCCGGQVEQTNDHCFIFQKFELIDQRPWEVTQHEAHAAWCPNCQERVYAPLPPEVERGGILGPKLLAQIAYLKGVMHASYKTIRDYFRNVLQLPISTGRLAKAIQQVSDTLAFVHRRLGEMLPHQAMVGVDETGHKDKGKRHWTWCFRAEAFTWFHIDPSRSSQVLRDILGEQFQGVLGCDYFSAYRKYMGEGNVLVQFCLAHLIRDLKFMADLPGRRNEATAAYGERLLDAMRYMFGIIHDPAGRSPIRLEIALDLAADRIIHLATTDVPDSREARAMAKRFEKHGRAYFQFITHPGVEPTNNLVEQALRFVVIDRRITQGTRSETGQRWCERIWTVIATCAQQGRETLEYLMDATGAWARGLDPPALDPANPGSRSDHISSITPLCAPAAA